MCIVFAQSSENRDKRPPGRFDVAAREVLNYPSEMTHYSVKYLIALCFIAWNYRASERSEFVPIIVIFIEKHWRNSSDMCDDRENYCCRIFKWINPSFEKRESNIKRKFLFLIHFEKLIIDLYWIWNIFAWLWLDVEI